MAVSIKKENEKTIIILSNGHEAALKKIVKDYNLIGEKEAVSFMLSVVADADGQAIKVSKGTFLPSEDIKNTSDKNGNEEA